MVVPLVLASLDAWGAARLYTSMPDWWPASIGLLTATTITVVSGAALLTVRSRTTGTFHLQLLSTFGGGVMLLMTAIVALTMAGQLTEEETYEYAQLFDKYGTLAAWALIMAAWLGIIAAAGGIYAGGIERTLKRYEKAADEPDAMGALIAEDEHRAN